MNRESGADASYLADMGVAAAIAAADADAVDREARFPSKAIDALRQAGAFGAPVSKDLGGRGISFNAVCSACFELSRRCASTGMVFAMHHIQLASIARHRGQSDFLQAYLEDVASRDRLIASVTSEKGTGGDLGQSIAPFELLPAGRARFEKEAPTVSYGAFADDLLVTLRRTPTAAHNDQVLALAHVDQTTMEQTAEWDTLGMRGTCSPAFAIKGELSSEQLVPVPFAAISRETMVPYSHLLCAFCWLGIATDATERSRAFTRARFQTTSMIGGPATLLPQLAAELFAMRAAIHGALAEYLAVMDTPNREVLGTPAYTLRINNLKVVASETAVAVCTKALGVCGIAGYRNGGQFSVGRHLRDALSAPLMIANDRIKATNALLLQMNDSA